MGGPGLIDTRAKLQAEFTAASGNHRRRSAMAKRAYELRLLESAEQHERERMAAIAEYRRNTGDLDLMVDKGLRPYQTRAIKSPRNREPRK